MQHRLGRCDDCRASYEIPASYLPRFARCRLCRGMVRIGRAGGEEPWRPMPRSAQIAPRTARSGSAPESDYFLPRVAATTLAPLTGELAFDEPLAASAWALADVLDGKASTRPPRPGELRHRSATGAMIEVAQRAAAGHAPDHA